MIMTVEFEKFIIKTFVSFILQGKSLADAWCSDLPRMRAVEFEDAKRLWEEAEKVSHYYKKLI